MENLKRPELSLQPCLPPAWARGAHFQTVLGHLLPSVALPRDRERLEIPLPGGDRLIASLLAGNPQSQPVPAQRRTLIYFFHGLGGDLSSGYMRRGAELAVRRGHGVMLVNHRGCGEGKGLAREPYHSGRAEDLSAAIDVGRRRFPRHRHVSVGFSLSGNALLLLLSGKRGGILPDAAISVNAPINLGRSARLLEAGFNRLYDLRFVLECRRDVQYRDRAGLLKASYRIPRWATLRDFDELYTAPAGGFTNREHYYESSSTRDLISEIRVPTILITAKDDPFVAYEDYRTARLSTSVLLHAEDFGGHMGYITGRKTPLRSRRWLDYAIDESVQSLLRVLE